MPELEKHESVSGDLGPDAENANGVPALAVTRQEDLHGSGLHHVTIIVRTFNRARSVRRAIDSVLEQQGALVRVVVVDDGSTDQTAEVLAAYAADQRVLVVRHQGNRGLTTAANTGLDHIDGRSVFFGFVDSDDRLLPGALRVLLDAWEGRDHDLSMVSGWDIDGTTGGRQGRFTIDAGEFTFDDLLAGRLQGDFFKLARVDHLGGLRFDERAAGGETVVWGPMLRRAPGLLIADPVLEVDRSGGDRASHARYSVADALGRMFVYRGMLRAYGREMRLRYPDNFTGHASEMAKWAVLAECPRDARLAARAAFRATPSLRGILILGISLAPRDLLMFSYAARDVVRRLARVVR